MLQINHCTLLNYNWVHIFGQSKFLPGHTRPYTFHFNSTFTALTLVCVIVCTKVEATTKIIRL